MKWLYQRCKLPLLSSKVRYLWGPSVVFLFSISYANAQAITPLPSLIPGSRPIPINRVATDSPKVFSNSSVVPMAFPVLGSCRWSDTYGAPRDSGQRKHAGQDLPAPKMRPLFAAFDGIWWGGAIEGDNGCTATYMHINNDTPGTDDGKGGEEFATAPGVWPGVHVIAGQHVAYCGDSGNAENTISHLHFELSVPNRGTINAAPSLRYAQKVTTPRYPLEKADFLPEGRELRIDGQIVGMKPEEGIITVRVAAWTNAKGKTTPQLRPIRRRITLPIVAITEANTNETGETIQEGDFIAVVGTDPGKGGGFNGRQMTLLRLNTSFHGKHRRRPQSSPSNFENTVPDADPSPTITPFPKVQFSFEYGISPWTTSGNCFGTGAEHSDYFRGRFSGWEGVAYLSTAHGTGTWIDRGRGVATSPEFIIYGSRLRFLIGGGDYAKECYMRLMVGGETVLSATGNNSDKLQQQEWDVSPYRGMKAQIEVVDQRSIGPRGYLLIDQIEVLPDE